MKAEAVRRLAALFLKRERRAALSSALGISVGVSSLVFFVALGLGVARVVQEKVFPVEANLLEVIPSPLSLGLWGGKLTEDARQRLQAIPGVRRAYRKMTVRVPAVTVYDGDFFGRRLRMGFEVLAVGVDPDFVAKDVSADEFRDVGPGQPIPALAATRLLEIYNKAFAPGRSLPPLTGAMVTGFVFPVEWNRSFVAETKPGVVVRDRVQVAGVSDRGLLPGITIPFEAARRINEAAGADAKTLSAVVLEATDPSQVPSMVQAVKEIGFRVDDQDRRMAENAGAAVAITTSALALLSVLICVLAAFNIFHAFSASVRARVRELGVMRAVGASRGDIFRLVMVEASVLGLLGGLIGTVVAVGLCWLVDGLAAHVLPEFPFKPEGFFRLPFWLLAGGIVLGQLSAVAGAWLPARRASSIDPSRVLAGAGD